VILYHGERRTPKELAAILVREKLEELPADWTPENIPGEQPTPGERLAVIEQIAKYRARFYKILSVMDGEEPADLGAAGQVLRDILEPRS